MSSSGARNESTSFGKLNGKAPNEFTESPKITEILEK